jgi:superkiller protein 3
MLFARKVNFGRAALLFVAVAASAVTAGQGVCLSQTRAASPRQSASRAGQSDAVVAEGVAAIDRGDLDSARSLFEKALGLNPKDVEAHRYLGLLDDRANDLDGAEHHFAQAARFAPSSASARNNYGVILLRRGRAREAASEFEASLRADPQQPNALVNLAQIRFAGGTPEDLRVAADLFARADRIAPDAEIARALTVIALRRNDRTAAAAHYQDYATRIAKEGGASSGDAGARSELGSALLEAELLREAESELSAAAALDPSNAESVVRLARVHLARKDIPAAGRTLEAAVARGIDAAPIYALLSEVYEQSGHPENAIPAMRLAIQRDPQSEKYRFAYGILLTNTSAPAAAVIRLEEALKTFPTSPRLWFALGLAHYKNNINDKAESALKRAAELDPKFAPAFAYLGMVRIQLGNYAEGVGFYEKALQVDPKLAVVHYLIADALLKQPDAEAARIESHLKRAVEMDATFAPARLALAKLFMRGERWAEAVAALEGVVKLDPNEAEAYYQLGRAYGRMKRTEEARTAMATFKNLSETQKQKTQNEQREIVRRLADVRF